MQNNFRVAQGCLHDALRWRIDRRRPGSDDWEIFAWSDDYRTAMIYATRSARIAVTLELEDAFRDQS